MLARAGLRPSGLRLSCCSAVQICQVPSTSSRVAVKRGTTSGELSCCSLGRSAMQHCQVPSTSSRTAVRRGTADAGTTYCASRIILKRAAVAAGIAMSSAVYSSAAAHASRCECSASPQPSRVHVSPSDIVTFIEQPSIPVDDTPRAFALLRRTVTYMRELIDGAMLTIGLLFAVAEVASRLLEPAHVLARSLHVLAAASAGFGAAFYAARSRTIYVDREWQQDQIPHPSWDAFGGSSYLRPSFDGVPPCTTSGPDLRELTLRYFRWSRDGDNRSSGLTALGNEEPWPWVWAQKPSIGSVVVVVGSDAAAASTLADVCGSRDPQLMTVVAIGDEQALRALDVGSGPTQIVAVLDADVHSIDWEAGLLLTTPRSDVAGERHRQPLSNWHPEERILFFDELHGVRRGVNL